MKKLLILLMMIIPMTIQAKEYELYCSLGGGVTTGGPYFETDSIRLEFSYNAFYRKFLAVKVINKLDERITVEWENARLGNYQICFLTDNSYSFNNPKPDEVVHAKSNTSKSIGERAEYMGDIVSEFMIKNHGESVQSILIPIRFSSGKVVDYKMYVNAKYKQ